MTYARLRDILSMLDKSELAQEAVFLINSNLEKIDNVDSFRGDKKFADKFNSHPHQIFLTNNKQL